MENLADQLVLEHMHLVHQIASTLRRKLGRSMEPGDLVGYGTQGLIEVVKKFDPKRGQFANFAHYRIRGAMIDGMRKMGWYSRSDCARYRAEERATAFLAAAAEREAADKLANPADPASPAADRGQILEDIAEILDGLATVHIASIEAARNLADERFQAPDEALAGVELGGRIRAALAKLPDKERELVELYYFADMNLEAVGKRLGLSKSWLSRLHARAVKLLGRSLEELNR
jgi:RNA polymerase sigma factor FliA